MTDLLLSLTLGIVGVVIYRSTQSQIFYGLPWSKRDDDFWGIKSYRRKYEQDYVFANNSKERFPGSTTWLVFLTDWVHLGQWIWLKCLYAIIALHSPYNFWYSFFVTWIVLGTALWATGKFLKR